MSKFFKILGLMVLLFGLLDFGLLSYRVSLWRVLGFQPWWLIGNYTFAFEILYGALTIFVANYLRAPVRKVLNVIDLSDPLIGADPHYVSIAPPPVPLRTELYDVAKGLLWGVLIGAAFLFLFVRYAPGIEGLLFSGKGGQPVIPASEKRVLLVAAVLAVVLPMVFGILVLRLREWLGMTAMVAGWAVTCALLIVAVLETPRLGHAVYGRSFMEQVYRELGHPGGLPSEWSVEEELIARLQRAGPLR